MSSVNFSISLIAGLASFEVINVLAAPAHGFISEQISHWSSLHGNSSHGNTGSAAGVTDGLDPKSKTKKVGDYVLDFPPLGEGSFGQVFKCWHQKRPNFKYACKTAKRGNSELMSEAGILKDLNPLKDPSHPEKGFEHPNIIGYVDQFQDDQYDFYLVMELAGEDLDSALSEGKPYPTVENPYEYYKADIMPFKLSIGKKDGKFYGRLCFGLEFKIEIDDLKYTFRVDGDPHVEAVNKDGRKLALAGMIFTQVSQKEVTDAAAAAESFKVTQSQKIMLWSSQIASGLKHMHSKKYLHGDLKPANILVGADGIAKLTDFGFTRKESNLGSYSGGTVIFNAPEAGSWMSDQKTLAMDMWSFGCVLFEMIELKPAFPNPEDITQDKIPEFSEKNLQNDNISSLRDIFQQIMQKDPANRPTAEFCVNAIPKVLFGQGTKQIFELSTNRNFHYFIMPTVYGDVNVRFNQFVKVWNVLKEDGLLADCPEVSPQKNRYERFGRNGRA